MIIALSSVGEKNIAIRFSEFEGMDTIRLMYKKINWIWIDCFNVTPLTIQVYNEIKQLGLKICLVSPELQGRPNDILSHINFYLNLEIKPDMDDLFTNEFIP